MNTTDPVTIGFDPGARFALSIDRMLPDDGREHLVEVVMRRRSDGEIEVSIEHDDGDVIATAVMRSGFLFSAHQVARARQSAAA